MKNLPTGVSVKCVRQLLSATIKSTAMFVFFSVALSTATTASEIKIAPGLDRANISTQMEIYRSTDEIPIENFHVNHPAMERLSNQATNHGFSQKIFYLKVDFADVPTDQAYFMELQFPLLNHVEFMIRANPTSKIVTGNRELFSSRSYFDRKFRFRLPEGTSTALLKI